MDDLISRQAAIDDLSGKDPSQIWDTADIEVWVNALPSAQPERKKGKWIDAEWENINTGEIRKGRRCSVCKCGYFHYDVSVNTVSDIPNFCPNCGADMRGGEANEAD